MAYSYDIDCSDDLTWKQHLGWVIACPFILSPYILLLCLVANDHTQAPQGQPRPQQMDLSDAHKHSSHNKSELEASKVAGCFYCQEIFDPQEIYEWVGRNKEGELVGDMALCPYCGIDSVLGDKSGYPITKEFMAEMSLHYFDNPPRRADGYYH